MSIGLHQHPFRPSLNPDLIQIAEAGPRGILILAYRHIKWRLVSKLLLRAFPQHLWMIPGTCEFNLILSLFKCVPPPFQKLWLVVVQKKLPSQLWTMSVDLIRCHRLLFLYMAFSIITFFPFIVQTMHGGSHILISSQTL